MTQGAECCFDFDNDNTGFYLLFFRAGKLLVLFYPARLT